jgi:hypothetical protein
VLKLFYVVGSPSPQLKIVQHDHSALKCITARHVAPLAELNKRPSTAFLLDRRLAEWSARSVQRAEDSAELWPALPDNRDNRVLALVIEAGWHYRESDPGGYTQWKPFIHDGEGGES